MTIMEEERKEQLFAISCNTKSRRYQIKLSKGGLKMIKGKYFFTHHIIKLWNSLPRDVVNVISFHGFKKQLDTNMEGKAFIDYDRQRNNPQVRKLHSHRLQETGKLKCGNINVYFPFYAPSQQAVITGHRWRLKNSLYSLWSYWIHLLSQTSWELA